MKYNEPKASPKQIPLFEEQDDGNLKPYVHEDWGKQGFLFWEGIEYKS